ncbi:MAG: nucleoside permease nupX [Nitrospina sp.]|nr:nucleoside permease nupX [Nitrospina sp.]
MDEILYRVIAFTGFFIICFIAWLTGNKDQINKKTILGSIFLAWSIGGMTFWLPWTRQSLEWLNNILISVLQASQKGSIFLFGPLAIGPDEVLSDGTQSIGFILALQVLPSVIFFSAIISLLYYLNIIQTCVNVFAKFFYKSMALSGPESFSAATSIFFGIESSLTIRNYLDRMSQSELLTLITCMMSTVATTVMAVYVIALKEVFPQIAGHLISASIISIPCAVLISKLSLPENKPPQTLGYMPKDIAEKIFTNSDLDINTKKPTNVMVVLMEGGALGVKLAISIATLLIIILGLQEIVDLILNLIPKISGQPISINRIFGWFVWPFTLLIGLKPDEWEMGSKILGSRFIETEVSAYFQLAAVHSNQTLVFSLRSFTALTYALCGFVHLASLGIFVGGLTAIIPSKAKEISILGLRSLWTAFLATLLTGSIAGALAYT